MRSIIDGLAAAEADADRFHGSALQTPWRPQRRRRKAWLAAAVLCGTLACGVLLAESERAPMAASPAADPLHPASLFSDAQPAAALAAGPVAAEPAAASAPTPPRAAQRIDLDGGEIVIDIAALPLADAARRLAALTRSEIVGDLGAIAPHAIMTRRWRGGDAARAWRALLGDDASYALRCHAQGCRVWLAAAPAPAALLAAGPVLDRRAATPVAAVEPMQPDPPGLFPTEPGGDDE